MIRVTCLGGAGSVTGSNYLIESPHGKKILVDCGLFQGSRRIERRNWEPWGFDPEDIEILFLTHAHIDHSGRIPKLVKDGFRGKIMTSPPTAELCGIMLLDSAHVQEMEAEWQNRRNRRQDRRPMEPLYTAEDAEASLSFFHPIERDKTVTIEPGLEARLRNAGHILGSSILELWFEADSESVKVVFSGDLGKKSQLIVRDPHQIFNTDYLFLESTYGNRVHRSLEESKKELLEAIRHSYAHGEKTIIPAFAVERTQEILYVLGEFRREGLLPDIPVYLDSPLAIKATEIFKKNKKYYDEEAQALVDQDDDPFDMPNLQYTPSTRESIQINERSGPAIVIAGNGMMTGGRVKHHLKHNLWREGASLVIVGFQTRGSTGRRIIEGAKFVKIFGQTVAVKARVFTIGGFSAHADQNDLLRWVGHFESSPQVFVVHGEATASQALAREIEKRFNLKVHVPRWRERLVLKPRELSVEEPEELEAAPDFETMILNGLIDLDKEIKALRKRVRLKAKTDDLEEGDVDRLKYVQEELRTILS
jgi:metallo-beta-lactamase family protein